MMGKGPPQLERHEQFRIDTTAESVDEEADTIDTEVTSDNKSHKA